jgi:glycosyltransferase involved in cell wall biosynthesis
LKILYIHNDYYRPSGEEHAAEALVSLLQENGHEVTWYRRGSTQIDKIFAGRLRAPFLSIHNPVAVRAVRRLIREEKPNIVQVQNLYPLISPGVLRVIKEEGIPLVMRCPNYRLFCPTGLFFDSYGNICEACTGAGHELWCIRKNCMANHFKSVSYAFRSFVARITNVFSKNVDIFIVQSDFQKKKFIEHGIPEEKIAILSGITPEVSITESEQSTNNLVSFVGRVSREKGIDDFLAAAAMMPDVRFAIAGNVPDGQAELKATSNVEWKGFLKGKELADLYCQSAVFVVPSKCYEGFPNVITRAMLHSKPVITTNLGCFPEIIDQEINGFLYPPGAIEMLVSCIRQILSNPENSAMMGIRGREKAERKYSRKIIYDKLMGIYSMVLPLEP